MPKFRVVLPINRKENPSVPTSPTVRHHPGEIVEIDEPSTIQTLGRARAIARIDNQDTTPVVRKLGEPVLNIDPNIDDDDTGSSGVTNAVTEHAPVDESLIENPLDSDEQATKVERRKGARRKTSSSS